MVKEISLKINDPELKHDTNKNGSISLEELAELEPLEQSNVFVTLANRYKDTFQVGDAVEFYRQISQQQVRGFILRNWKVLYPSPLNGNEAFLREVASTDMTAFANDLACGADSDNFILGDPFGAFGYGAIIALMPEQQIDIMKLLPTDYELAIRSQFIRENQPTPWVPMMIKTLDLIWGDEPIPKTHDSIILALQEIGERNIRVYAFGEFHSQGPIGIKTSHGYFVSEVVPYLIEQQKVQVIGTEVLPQDLNDEIEKYLLTGNLAADSRLADYIARSLERESITALLLMIKGYRDQGRDISLMGVGLDIQIDSLTEMEDDKRINLAETIRKNSIELISHAYSNNLKLVIYTGTAHNTVFPYGIEGTSTFADKIGVPPDEYIEIDLISEGQPGPPPQGQDSRWQGNYQQSPPTGVALIHGSSPPGLENSFLLIISNQY